MKKESQRPKAPSSKYVPCAKGKTWKISKLKECYCFTIKLFSYQGWFIICEAWSNLTPKDYLTLRASQLIYLRNVLEVSKATPIAAMYLELGILPVWYEIEMRQLLFLKHLLDKKHADPCLRTYIEMLKFENETNWANNVLGLRRAYNLPLSDENK